MRAFVAYFYRYAWELSLPIGPRAVPFWGFILESYKVIPKWNYYGAYG